MERFDVVVVGAGAAGSAAAARDQRIFESVVELGLGDGRLDGRTIAMIASGLVVHPAMRGSR